MKYNPNNLTIEEFVDKSFVIGNFSYKTVSIDGIEGKMTSDIPGLHQYEDFFIRNSSKIFMICYDKGSQNGIAPNTFDQILFTFKFTQ